MAPETEGLTGLLLLDKPAGLTSHDLVVRIRRLAGLRRVGHIGTLDPLATGLMGVLLGRATLLAPYLSGLDKTYRGVIELGLATDTDDVAGRVISRCSGPWPERIEIDQALSGFVGRRLQVPPDYSAVQVGGRRAYRAARAGTPLELAAREVMAESLELLGYRPPLAEFTARVSSGYYIRALARDLGQTLKLGGGALSSLRRTGLGFFRLDQARTLEEAAGWDQAGWAAALIPPARAVAHLPAIRPTAEGVRRFGQGRELRSGEDFEWPALERPACPYRVLDPAGELLGLGYLFEPSSLGGGRSPGPFLRPRRVFAAEKRPSMPPGKENQHVNHY